MAPTKRPSFRPAEVLSYFWKPTKRETPPFLTPSAAAGLSVLFTLTYVLPFYISPKTRPSPNLHRDSPTVIRARIRAVTFACIVTSIATIIVASYKGELEAREIFHYLGWWPIGIWDIFSTLFLVAILFAGPLFEGAFVEGRLGDWLFGRNLRETFGSATGWRAYVAGPITEELVFRSLIVPLHLWAGFSPTKAIFITPLYFGIAHVHHFYEFKLTHPYTPLVPALLRSIFQFAYTSLFGFFAAFAFVRTGSLPVAILTHSFCNWMGLPRFWGRVDAEQSLTVARFFGKESTIPAAPKSPRPQDDVRHGTPSILWTVVYYVLLCAGAYGFYANLWLLTESSNAIADFSGKPK